MIDLLEPGEPFNITMFQQYAKAYIREIHQRGHIPILVGGTGFYIQSVLYDIDFTRAQEDVAYRAKLEEMWEEGAEQMHRLLRQIDPVSADTIHANNRKRVIRALEYYHLTGQKISEHNAIQRSRESIYNACYFVLNDHRQRIYASIDRRVDQMLADGLVEEVKALARMGCNREMVSMQGLGYQEILAYLEGEITLERAVYLIKRDTRHFAKRQLTWFRRERDVIWLEKERFCYREENILDYIQQKMREKKIGAD